jgi:hypothetical protein
MADFIKISNTSSMSLEELKAYKYREIDNKTGKLISQGFTYSGTIFSMSANAQANLLGTYTARDLLT